MKVFFLSVLQFENLAFYKMILNFSAIQAFSAAFNSCTDILCPVQYPFLLVG